MTSHPSHPFPALTWLRWSAFAVVLTAGIALMQLAEVLEEAECDR